MKIFEIIEHLQNIAPASFQEAYDNSGLLTGDGAWECTGILVTLDATEEVVQEAISKGHNLVVAHHPIIFKGLKKITGENYVQRTVILAIKNDVAIYAVHTNLDNVIGGVNGRIAEILQLHNVVVLQPREQLLNKLVTFAPVKDAEALRNALFTVGAGKLGKYSECSFNTEGTGTFKAEDGADPHVGEIGKRHEEKETKIEMIFPEYLRQKVVSVLLKAHPYEEVAYDILSLGNYLPDVGSGLVGDLPEPVGEQVFLEKIRRSFGIAVIKHTAFTGREIMKVAVCGGAGSFLIPAALKSGAGIYITADIKYHEFFDADKKMVLADIGHYESEKFTIDLLHVTLQQKFSNFAVQKTGINTNPVRYFL